MLCATLSRRAHLAGSSSLSDGFDSGNRASLGRSREIARAHAVNRRALALIVLSTRAPFGLGCCSATCLARWCARFERYFEAETDLEAFAAEGRAVACASRPSWGTGRSSTSTSNRTCGFPASGFPTGFMAGSRDGARPAAVSQTR